MPRNHYPVAGMKLIVRRALKSGKEKVVFLTKDPGVGFPPFGISSDPRSAGVDVEIFSATEGFAFPWSSIPRDDLRWRTKDSPPSYRFRNLAAPAGASGVRTLVLVKDRMLKVSTRQHALDLMDPQISVGIVVRMGLYWTCAKFGPGSIRRERDGLVVARDGVAPINCRFDTLLEP
jgi:hypothetical protein